MGETESKLAAEIARQGERIAELEARLERLETSQAQDRAARPSTSVQARRDLRATKAATSRIQWTVGLPALVGRTIMTLGGAFFVRALTDRGTLPATAGVATGVAYALIWVLLADRAARAGHPRDATAHGLATTLIAFPLVWETTTRFGLMSPPIAALTLTGVAATVLGVAWAQRLRLLAWVVTVASTMTGVALLFATKSLFLFSVALFVLAVASLATSYHREWYGQRWPAAIALDLLVVLAMFLLGKTNYEWLHPPDIAAVQLLLTVTYLGIIGVRTIVLLRPMREFGVAQSLIVLAIGFEGARRVLGPEHAAAGVFGPVALVLAVFYYGVAFARFERDSKQRANWTWYVTLGTILVIYSAALLVHSGALGVFWALLALAAANLGRRDDRSAVRWNTMALALAAAVGSGLAGAAFLVFHAADPSEWLRVSPSVWGTAALCLAAWVISRWFRDPSQQARDRTLPGLALLAVAAVGVGSGVVAALGPVVSGAGTAAADTGALAVLRTAVICAAALVFAGLSRVRRHPELVWTAYGALSLAACKIPVDDMPNGRPMTMFLSFILFGGAMIVGPRLVPDEEKDAGKTEDVAR